MSNHAIEEAGLYPNHFSQSCAVDRPACVEIPIDGATPTETSTPADAVELIATQRAALDSHYTTREKIIEVLHAATDGPSRIAAVDKVLELLAAPPATPVSVPPNGLIKNTLDQLEGYFNRESIAFERCQVLRSAIVAGSTRDEVHNGALEAAMGVCKRSKAWADVDAIRALKRVPSTLLAPTVLPAAADGNLELDAARWRAFLGSARIRTLGSTGINAPEPNNYAHLGLEIWTRYGNPGEYDFTDENAHAIDWLTKYADVARAAQAAPPINVAS